MCSAFALITGGLQAATPVLLPNVIYLALWPHSDHKKAIYMQLRSAHVRLGFSTYTGPTMAPSEFPHRMGPNIIPRAFASV